jgi:hypothetical protein
MSTCGVYREEKSRERIDKYFEESPREAITSCSRSFQNHRTTSIHIFENTVFWRRRVPQSLVKPLLGLDAGTNQTFAAIMSIFRVHDASRFAQFGRDGGWERKERTLMEWVELIFYLRDELDMRLL